MKALLTADLHLTDKREDAYRFSIFDVLQQEAENHDVDAIYFLGDITDKADNHSSWLVHKLTSHFEKLAEQWDIKILRGNHDCVDPSLPFFEFLNLHQHIDFITWGQEDKKNNVLFLPHSRQPEEDWKSFDFSKYDYIFFHQCFLGSQTPGGFELDGANGKSLLNEFQGKGLFAGDIHTPQNVSGVEYIGSPYSVKHGDHWPGRLIVLDLDTGDWEAVPLTNFPAKQSLKVENDSIDELVVQEGDYVKATLKLDPSERTRWKQHKQELKDKIESQGAIVSEIEAIAVEDVSERTTNQVSEEVEAYDDYAIFDRFCDKHGISSDFRTAGRRLLEEATTGSCHEGTN